jgi:hypothetical protein
LDSQISCSNPITRKDSPEVPKEWQRYRDEVNGVNKRAGDDRENVNAESHYRIEIVAYREKLDLDEPADRVAAQAKVFAEESGLYKRYRAANTVRVGKVSVTDWSGFVRGAEGTPSAPSQRSTRRRGPGLGPALSVRPCKISWGG